MTFRATITDLKRMANSVDGNPNWKVSLSGASPHRTQQDSTLGYEVDAGMIGKTFDITVNKEGRITDLVEAEEAT